MTLKHKLILGSLEIKVLFISRMPGERRNLRSSKESTSSTNGEKATSDSQSSTSNKDQSIPARTTSSKGKSGIVKKATANASGKDVNGDKPTTNGTEPVENGVKGSKDVEMTDKVEDHNRQTPGKDAEDEMTVVVPPPNSSKLSGPPVKDLEGDIAMGDADAVAEGPSAVDPKAKAHAGLSTCSYCPQLL